MRWLVPAVVVALLVACDEEPRAPESDTVATFRGGTLSRVDLVDGLLALPPARRPLAGALDEAWLREFVSEMVVDHLIDREAELTGFENDVRVVNARQEIERSQIWNAFVRENTPSVASPEESSLRAEFERRLDPASDLERRRLSLIFLRREAGEAHSALRARAAELRRRHLGGESFAALAAAHSDSESRTNAGVVGWVEKDQLEPAVAAIAFSLAEGETSEPVVTVDGAHLFRIDFIRVPDEIDFEESRDALAQQMAAAEQLDSLHRIARELPEPAGGFFVASAEELSALQAARDPSAIVLRAGGYTVHLGRLLERAGSEEGAPLELLEAMALRERAFAAALREGRDHQPHHREAIEQAVREEMRRLLRQNGMRRLLGTEDERIRAYFEQQQARFSTPLELSIEHLSIPAPDREKEVLLALGDRLRAGARPPGLEEVAEEFNGTVESLGWTTLPALRSHPAATAELPSLQAGQYSTPRHRAGVVEMLAVIDRREPAPRSLSAVLEEVRDAYLADHGQGLYIEWRTELLASADLRLYPMRPEGLREVLAPPIP